MHLNRFFPGNLKNLNPLPDAPSSQTFWVYNGWPKILDQRAPDRNFWRADNFDCNLSTRRKFQSVPSNIHIFLDRNFAYQIFEWILTSPLQVTRNTSYTCHFTNKNISDNPRKLEKLLLSYISQKNFRVPRTPHFADIELSKFLLINWKIDLPTFLQILRFQWKKAKNSRWEGPPNKNFFWRLVTKDLRLAGNFFRGPPTHDISIIFRDEILGKFI